MKKRNQTSQKSSLARRLVTMSFSVVALLSAATANANLLGNPGFESGDTSEWEAVGAVESVLNAGAIDYAAAFGGAVTTAYDGGTYGGYRRTGENEDKGYSQTVPVVSGMEIIYNLDFVAREVQAPGPEIRDQTIVLRLNGEIVGTMDAPSTEETEGNFSGNYTPSIDTVTFSMTSYRVAGWGNGNSQVYFDNTSLTCAEGDTCLREETPVVAPISIPTMSTYGFILMILGILFVVARRLRNTAG